MRHLSLADNIVVLGSNGTIEEQGPFETLRSQNGFVSRLLVHPELLQSKSQSDVGAKEDVEARTQTPPTVPAALRGPSANDMSDLARRIGDFSVYKYYLRAIGWKFALINVTACFVFNMWEAFPCKLAQRP